MSKTKRFEMRVTPQFLDMIDEWRRKQITLPSRARSIMALCEIAVNDLSSRKREGNSNNTY